MFSVRSCSPLVMKRFTPSMCHEPSACGIARVRPAPTSEPASGSVSTIVDAHWRSTKIFAHCFCSSVPSRCSVVANDGPDAYIQIGAFEPSTISASDHQNVRGAAVPSSSAGRSMRQNSLSMNASYERWNGSGIDHAVRGRVEDRRLAVGRRRSWRRGPRGRVGTSRPGCCARCRRRGRGTRRCRAGGRRRTPRTG